MNGRWSAIGALLLAACAPGDEELRHGYVRLELLREVVATDVSAALTTEVSATLRYGACLSRFYREHPEMRQEGPTGARDFGDADAGGEGWMDRLCDGTVPRTPECEVVSIQQVLAGSEQLTVTYAVEGIRDNNVLVFGPLPTLETAACAGDELPSVHVVSHEAVRGEAEDGSHIWYAATYDPAEVATGPASVIRIHRGPVD